MTYDFHACRLCRVMDGKTKTRYGKRHWAHPVCALQKWGAAFFDRLSLWQLEQFPAIVANRFGVLDVLIRKIEKLKGGT